jgi:hypothetical protein
MNMSRVGKNTVASVATIMCIVFCLSAILPLSGAQSSDTTPPVTNASVSGTAGNNGWYRSNVTVSLSATDDSSGVSGTLYSLDNTPYVGYTSSLTLYEGNHTLAYYSIDNAGNSEQPKILNVSVDTKPPIVNMTITGNQSDDGWYNGKVFVNFTASDTGSGNSSIMYSYDNVIWILYTNNFTLENGQYTFYYGGYDKAGNVYNKTIDIKVFNPLLTLNLEPNKWYFENKTLTIGCDPGYSIQRSLDNKTWYPGSIQHFNWEGNHTFFYRALDSHGHVSDANQVWYGIDLNPPWIEYWIEGSQSSSGWYNGDVTVHINAQDKGEINHTEYSLDNQNWDLTPKYNGGDIKVSWGHSRTIYMRTTDKRGDTDSEKHWIYFAPGSYNQGSMSDSVWINGVLYGPSSGTSDDSETPETPTMTPTDVPWPTPTQAPSPTPETETDTGTGSPLALAVLIGVAAIIIVAAAAAYFFMLKPK